METSLAIGTVLLSLACLAALPFARRANQDLPGYFLMSGKLPLPGFVFAILAANLSIGNFLVFIASWGFLFGWAGIFWFLINLILNVVVYFLFIPAFKTYILDPTNSGTIHEYLATTFGGVSYRNRIRLVASATTILGLLFAIIFEIHLAADIFAGLLNVNIVTLFVLFTALICVYSGVGGFLTLVWTDWLQSIVMIVGTLGLIILLWMVQGLSTAASVSETYPITWGALNIGWPNILAICIVGSGWFMVAMDQWQRACATRSVQKVERGMIWYLLSIFGFAIVYGLVGIYDKTAVLPNLTPDLLKQSSQGANPLVDFFQASTLLGTNHFSPYLFSLYALALLAAAMSTANTFLIVSGHSFVSDLLIGVAKKSSLHDLSPTENRMFLAIARGTIVGMGAFVIGGWLALRNAGLLTDPLSFFFIAYSIQFALLAPMVFARAAPTLVSSPVLFHTIWLTVAFSLAWSLLWWRLPAEFGTLLGAAPSDWLALSPVAAWAFGSIILLVFRRSEKSP